MKCRSSWLEARRNGFCLQKQEFKNFYLQSELSHFFDVFPLIIITFNGLLLTIIVTFSETELTKNTGIKGYHLNTNYFTTKTELVVSNQNYILIMMLW